MLNKIKNFFEANFSISEQPDNQAHQLKLATAALLIEMMMQDDDVHEAEQRAVKNSLGEKFNLTGAETEALYELARQESKNATDYHQFTSLIAKHFSQPQKIKIIEYLWQVAYADKVLDRYEEHMVRRIADLIHVSHKDFIQAKHRVVPD
ncbi:MAG: TerB family tellurite resistance protein [Gammaproteobacteria bacterium]|nr:TerB family tellurite resistance protein [Gammaproteobacteria bacterium]